MSVGEFLSSDELFSANEPFGAAEALPRSRAFLDRSHRRFWHALNDDEEDEVAAEVERRARLEAKREAAIPQGRVPVGPDFTRVRPPHPQARPLDPGVEVALQVLILRGAVRGGL